MKNPLNALKDKIKSAVARLKRPEVQAKLMQRGGIGLLGGAGVAVIVLIAAPAAAVPAGVAALGLLGVGFGLLQESDNKMHAIWMKEHPAAVAEPAPAPKAEPPAPAIPVAEVKPATQAFEQAVAAKAETPAPKVVAPVIEPPKPPVP